MQGVWELDLFMLTFSCTGRYPVDEHREILIEMSKFVVYINIKVVVIQVHKGGIEYE
jgi:hypothetical protein